MSTPSITPSTPQTLQAFREAMKLPRAVLPELPQAAAEDIGTIWASIQQSAITWRGAQPLQIPEKPTDRREFWGLLASNPRPAPLPLFDQQVDQLFGEGEGKIALDLGSGNSPSAISLLQRGWKVIAVDSSSAALKALEKRASSLNPRWVSSGQLQIVEADVSAFTPSGPVDLVVAIDIFPFLNPTQFPTVWKKVSSWIKENGFLVGTLFRAIQGADPFLNLQEEMGAWYLRDRRMVSPLLRDAGYEAEVVQLRSDIPYAEPGCIQFIGKK